MRELQVTTADAMEVHLHQTESLHQAEMIADLQAEVSWLRNELAKRTSEKVVLSEQLSVNCQVADALRAEKAAMKESLRGKVVAQWLQNALGEAKADRILENRLKNIREKITQTMYDYTCMGIFEMHKLLFRYYEEPFLCRSCFL